MEHVHAGTWTHRAFSFTTLLWALLIALTSGGCSVIGYSVGSAHDAHAHDTLSIKNVASLSAGDEVFLLKNDGDSVKGAFASLERRPASQSKVPAGVGTQISFLSLASGVRRSGRLLAIDSDTLLIRLDGNDDVMAFSEEKVKDIMDSENLIIDQESLKVMAGRLPPFFQKVLNITEGQRQRSVPVNEIRLLRHNDATSSRWMLAGGGLVVDAAVIGSLFAIYNSFDHVR
jgi:hypothetical protein